MWEQGEGCATGAVVFQQLPPLGWAVVRALALALAWILKQEQEERLWQQEQGIGALYSRAFLLSVERAPGGGQAYPWCFEQRLWRCSGAFPLGTHIPTLPIPRPRLISL